MALRRHGVVRDYRGVRDARGGSRSGFRLAIFEYVEVFHNHRRRHSALGMLTPSEYDKLYEPKLAA